MFISSFIKVLGHFTVRQSQSATMINAAAFSFRGYFHAPRPLDCFLLVSLVIAAAFVSCSVTPKPITSENHFLFRNHAVDKSMYSMGPVSFLQRFLTVELMFVVGEGLQSSGVNLTSVSHIRTSTYVDHNSVVQFDGFDQFDTPLVLFEKSMVQSGYLGLNLVFAGDLSQFKGYVLRFITGNAIWGILGIWFKSVFCVIAVCVALCYHRAVTGFVGSHALLNPLNLFGALSWLNVITNFPDFVFCSFNRHWWLQMPFAAVAALFRTGLTIAFGIMHTDHSGVVISIGVLVLTGIEVALNCAFHLDSRPGIESCVGGEVSLLVSFGGLCLLHSRGSPLSQVEHVLEIVVMVARLTVTTMRLVVRSELTFFTNILFDNGILWLLLSSSFPAQLQPIDALPERRGEPSGEAEKFLLVVEPLPPVPDETSRIL
jgi:hypothetical protein